MDLKKISVVSPAFNEDKNLPELHAELVPVLEKLNMDWEWIIIDDHSTDSTPDVIKRLSEGDFRIKGLRMAKNTGSHALCLMGLKKASGDCAVLMSSDGQDPPQYIPKLVEEMKKSGSRVVWLTRGEGRSDPFFKSLMARFYYFFIRRVMGISSIPRSGGDMVLVEGAVLTEMQKIKEKNINILAAICELGFSQTHIPGKRRARAHGKGNFTFAKNINLIFDTLTSHSVAPLRAMTFLGSLTAFLGFLYGINVIVSKISGIPVEGWEFIVLTVLILGGVQMIMLGVIGEYLWRALENTRKRSVAVEYEIGDWSG